MCDFPKFLPLSLGRILLVGVLTLSVPILYGPGYPQGPPGGQGQSDGKNVKVINSTTEPVPTTVQGGITADVMVVNEPNVSVTNTVDTNTLVTNDEANPVPVVIQGENTPEPFMFGESFTVTAPSGGGFQLTRPIPAGKLAMIEYISVINTDNNAPADQVLRFTVIAPQPNIADNLFAVKTLTSPGGGFIGGGEKVFLPAKNSFLVGLLRSNTTIQSDYRVTVTGSLVEAP